jgi:hypothetical protein
MTSDKGVFMKKFSVFSVMPIFLLVFGLAFTTCDSGSTGGVTTGPFFGTWIMDRYAGYSFSDDLIVTQFVTDGDGIWWGTFTYTDTVIMFSFANREYSMYYTLSDTVLNLQIMNPDDDWWGGNFIKQRYDNGSTSGKILGLSYSEKKEMRAFQNEKCISYLLEHSYDEALKILTGQLGEPNVKGGCYAQGTGKELVPFMSRPNWVMFQDYEGVYSLLSISNYGSGVAWHK